MGNSIKYDEQFLNFCKLLNTKVIKVRMTQTSDLHLTHRFLVHYKILNDKG